VLGFAVVLAGPVLLFRDALNPSPWNETTLRAEFQSIRYESGGLVFRYAVHNLTRHAAQFQPALTEIHALQAKDRPPVGYPNIMLPLNVPARGSHVVEVRLELASFMHPPASLSSDDQTRRVLQNPPPGEPAFPADPPVSPLPMHGPSKPATPAMTVDAAEFSLQDALTGLNGFELVDETNGIRLVLPRGW
jgi:diadenosine tetraphosphatase ApaH/serine/threonine PP2A family protein phosphatase